MHIGGKGTATDTAGRNNFLFAKKKEKREGKTEKDTVKRQWSLADKRKHSEVRVKTKNENAYNTHTHMHTHSHTHPYICV